MHNVFDIDLAGFRQALAPETPRILLEPISNALDTAATEILVRFSHSRGVATYAVEDNDPEGFAELTDAFTLFAPSVRKANPLARGRFGFGEKEFVAICLPGTVEISTTTGTVTFDGKTRTVRKGAAARREAGSAVTARFRISSEHAENFVARLRTMLVPDGVQLTLDLDGEIATIAPRPELRRLEVTLPTIIADETGALRPTRRKTVLSLHEVNPGEEPMLFELGIPVVSHPGTWHINVHQKVPLARSRDAVTTSYLRAVLAAALEAGVDLLAPETAKLPWVTAALEDAPPVVVKQVLDLVYGANAVIADPSCREATKRAIDHGFEVIPGGAFSGRIWQKIRDHRMYLPAGQHEGLRGDVVHDRDVGIVSVIEAEEIHPRWRIVMAYAKALCLELLDRDVDVCVCRAEGGQINWLATWQNRDGGERATLTLNAALLPTRWWHEEEAIDELLLHEFAHAKVADHLSDAFHEECCRLGARLRTCRTRVADFCATDAPA